MKILLPITSLIAFIGTLYFLANRSPIAALVCGIIAALLMTIFWILMIISSVKRKNYDSDEAKLIWILVVILLGHLGALIYYFAVDVKQTRHLSTK